MKRSRNIFHSVLFKISRYTFLLIAQLNVHLKYVYFVLAHSELAHDVKTTEGPSRTP